MDFIPTMKHVQDWIAYNRGPNREEEAMWFIAYHIAENEAQMKTMKDRAYDILGGAPSLTRDMANDWLEYNYQNVKELNDHLKEWFK